MFRTSVNGKLITKQYAFKNMHQYVTLLRYTVNFTRYWCVVRTFLTPKKWYVTWSTLRFC